MHATTRVATRAAMLLLASACSNKGGDTVDPAADTFTIGGTVTGLAGSGLVLQGGGISNVTVGSGATTFAFAGSVGAGTTYNVSVRTQPVSPSQTCTVANSTGTVAANVANIAVTCVTNSFTVGGSIAGLTSSGLVLRFNDSQTAVVVPGSPTFTFGAVLSGTSYAVTVGTQPSSPSQTCSVASGAGTVGAANVTSIAVTCASITVGGNVAGLTGTGLALRINGGTPIPVAPGATSFTFPNVFPTGTDYRVTITGQPATPVQVCTLARGQGRTAGTAITNILVMCTTSTTSPLSGTYAIDGAYVTFWPDGTYAFSERSDDPDCGGGNGTGIEYGAYTWNATTGAFTFLTAVVDGNGTCGISKPGLPPLAGVTLVKFATSITFTAPGQPPLVIPLVASTPGTLVGSFSRDDGNDGSFIVFHADGTYLVLDAQNGTGNGTVVAGFERGCYTVVGATIVTNLAAACRPDGKSAIDLNATGSFSDALGAPIPFSFPTPNTLVLGTRTFLRIIPN